MKRSRLLSFNRSPSSSTSPARLMLLCMLGITSARADVGGCQRETLSKITSPDHAWVALLHQDVCSDGAFTAVLTNVVQLVRQGKAPAHKGEIFSVDVGGNSDNAPEIQWATPRLLQIVVPNKSLIGLSKKTFDGVDIVVKFNPDDPEERQNWLKEIGQKSKR
jgi:hypothetical protein